MAGRSSKPEPSRNPQSWFLRGRERVGSRRQGDALTRARSAADAVVADTPDAGQRACVAGCAACCHFAVGASAAEVLALATHVVSSWSPAAVAALRRDLTARDRLVATESWTELAARRRPCVLLDPATGTCRAYAARPLACRGWTATSREACEADLAHARNPAGSAGGAPRPSHDGLAWVAVQGVRAALDDAVRADDLDEDLELASGLAHALTGPAWATRVVRPHGARRATELTVDALDR